MVMNNKGQVLLYSLMVATLMIVLILSLAGPVKTFIESSKNQTECENSTISDYDKAACYTYDIIFLLFVGLGIILAIIIIGSKLI